MAFIKDSLPAVKEVFFDDDTFTDDRPRAEEIARGMGALGLTWSCNAKANVPYETLKVMRDNGLRLVVVGFESGTTTSSPTSRKGSESSGPASSRGTAAIWASSSTARLSSGFRGRPRRRSGRRSGLPSEINPHTLQVSIAAPYPGTALYRQAKEEGWLPDATPR